jgi:hypothetical protein
MKPKIFIVIIIVVSLTFTGKVMADANQPVDSTKNTSQPQDIMQQKYFDFLETQKKALQETHEKSLKSLESDEKLHEEKAKSHEEYVRMQDEAEKTQERYTKLEQREEADQARFEKILSTWERQQQQYQSYLDSLKH